MLIEIAKSNWSDVSMSGKEPCNRESIMVVDDEPAVRNLFKAILHLDMPDVNIDLASNGLEAVAKLGK